MDSSKTILDKTFTGYQPEDFVDPKVLYQGKVRDVIDLGSELILSVSDRVSAYDCILGTIPLKGQILNQMALYWFEQTKDILQNHLIESLSPRAVRVKKCEVLPVEIIVRSYLTGSAWRDYTKGKAVSGIKIPEGFKADQKFDKPIITPSTKAEQGFHDEPISREEIISRGLVSESLWQDIEQKALALFQRGTELAAKQGLILVDTKYEMGLYNGELILVDEIHTPDSSRYWFADTYESLFEKGESQRKLDKEYLRKWLADQGFMGDGNPPVIPDDVRLEVTNRYKEAFELLTGKEFYPEQDDIEVELSKIKSYL
ncbi:phosphoribosylaminoimidazolesuccinocarboxamide synthase [Spirochaeta cellobiosiphila]|uniref:phosphoribosylaminoimidazolesuccinocarboxamide synthase n=1 Tax=Spirochaeta cellobiosiphila TaxID=504483 RepID=UPI00041A7358|nr:phosphoribosylaminoimidazolesuccinocarboxamide synthase [Spirochaeta cellobiosiphila]